MNKMSVLFSDRKVFLFLEVCFGFFSVACVHLSATWNEVKVAFSESVCCLGQRTARVLGCRYYLSGEFMSLNNKLLAQSCR